MDITPLVSKNANIIKGYGSGFFNVNDESYKNSVIIAENMLYDWSINSFDDLNIESFSQSIDSINPDILIEYEILLLGTGSKFRIPTPDFQQKLHSQIAIDYMDSAAAARTYNVLLAEGRKVIAALIMLD